MKDLIIKPKTTHPMNVVQTLINPRLIILNNSFINRKMSIPINTPTIIKIIPILTSFYDWLLF